jgi:hypothetical protein
MCNFGDIVTPLCVFISQIGLSNRYISLVCGLIHYDLSNNAIGKIGLSREIYVTVVIILNHTTKTEVFCKQDYSKGPLGI